MPKKNVKAVQDLVFDDATWVTHFLPIIEAKIDARLQQVPVDLLHRISELGNIEVSKRHFLLFNFKKLKFENEHLRESLRLRSEVIDIINAPELVDEILTTDFQYQEGGPITQELLDKYPVLNKFDWSTSIFRNNFTSSWGIFRDHIIINDAQQLFIATVQGKTTVHKIVNTRKSILFTNVLPQLNFQLMSSKKPREKQRFENRDFATQYHWEWNDDVGVLMYFTPWFQELFLKINDYSKPKDKYALYKEGHFITACHQSTFTSAGFDAKDIDYRYLSVNDVNNDEYFALLKETIIKFLKDRYDALAFVTIIPIIKSETEHRFLEEFVKTSATISHPQNANNIANYLIHENRMLHNNAFTRVDDFDMFGADSLKAFTTPHQHPYYVIPVNRTRCFSRFNMSSTITDVDRLWTEFDNGVKSRKRYEKHLANVTKCVDNLIYWTGERRWVYTNSNFYHYSNFDPITTFKLDLWCDQIKRRYHCNNIVVKNGLVSVMLKKDVLFDEQLIDAFYEIVHPTKKIKEVPHASK